MLKIKLLGAVALIALTACSGEETQNNETTTTTETTTTEATPTEAPKEDATVTSGNALVIEANMLNYSADELTVTTGEEITLTFNNVGTVAKDVMGHNVAILEAGVDVNEFIKAANAAGIEKNFLHDGAKVIAATKILGPGESDTVTFTAPAPGTYDFLCTFPGHSSSMKGKLIVKAS